MSGGFLFVTFSNPGEHEAYKRVIRSHAATHAHRVGPRKRPKSARDLVQHGHATPEPRETLVDPPGLRGPIGHASMNNPPSSSLARPATKKRWNVEASQPSSTRASGRPSASAQLVSSVERGNTLRELLPTDQELVQANIGRKRIRSRSPLLEYEPESSTGLVVQSKLPDPSYLDASQRDPFDTYPVPYQHWFGWLLDFWYAGTLPKGQRMVKASAEGMKAYILWSRRFQMTEPALFYTSLFLASGIPVSNGMLRVEKALWLRGQAVKALNEALSDPVRATSNAVISSIGKIALHEHIYGDREAAHRIHRPAQQR